jgi:hypothetical protein
MSEPATLELSKDSSLRALPARLDRRQRLFLDGLRLSAEMIFCAYARLWRLLWELSNSASGGPLPEGAHATAMLDAWSIVDGVHRVRELLRMTPLLKRSAPALEIFRRESQCVDDLRNRVQHLNQEYAAPEGPAGPAWGHLTWVRLIDCGPPELATTYAMVPGAIVGGLIRLANPIGKTHHGLIDHLELVLAGSSANLSKVTRAVAPLVHHLESFVSDLIRSQGLNPGGSDTILSMGPLQEGIDLGTGPLKPGDVIEIRSEITPVEGAG